MRGQVQVFFASKVIFPSKTGFVWNECRNKCELALV